MPDGRGGPVLGVKIFTDSLARAGDGIAGSRLSGAPGP